MGGEILCIRGRQIEVGIGERGNGESLWMEPEKNGDKKMVRETVGKVETVMLRLFFSITATNVCSGRMTSAQRLDRKEERG